MFDGVFMLWIFIFCFFNCVKYTKTMDKSSTSSTLSVRCDVFEFGNFDEVLLSVVLIKFLGMYD